MLDKSDFYPIFVRDLHHCVSPFWPPKSKYKYEDVFLNGIVMFPLSHFRLRPSLIQPRTTFPPLQNAVLGVGHVMGPLPPSIDFLTENPTTYSLAIGAQITLPARMDFPTKYHIQLAYLLGWRGMSILSLFRPR